MISPRPSPARRSLLWVVLVTLGLVLVPSTAGWSADNPPPTGFGVSPVDGASETGQRSLFSFGLPPGGVILDRVAVINYGQDPIPFDLYPADALNTADGSYALTEGTAAAQDLGKWITLDTPSRQITVPGRDAKGQPGKAIVPFRITIPANAAPGDHAAGIVASLTSVSNNPQSQNLRLEQRVAARVYVRVAGDAQPGLVVSDVTASYEAPTWPWQQGRTTVDYRVVNTGNIRMGFRPAVTVEGLFGLGATTVDAEPAPELLPRQERNARVVVDGVPPLGWMNVEVTATPTAAVAAAPPSIGPVSKSVRLWAFAVWVWSLLGGITLVVLVLLRRRRGRRRRPGSRRAASAGRRSTGRATKNEKAEEMAGS